MNSSNLSDADGALIQLAQKLRESGYRFITSTPLTHARVNARSENAQARNLRDVFGWSRPFTPEILPNEIWELMNAAQIVEEVESGFKSTLRLSSLGENLFFHSAFPTKQSDAVFFGPDTYRYISALEKWLASNKSTPRRIADIGSGSGAGAIVAALAFPSAEVVAVDINEAALRLTRINAILAGAENVRAQHSDLLKNVEGKFDLLIANPPYLLDPGARAYRHGGGDFGEGLSLQIIEAAKERLSVGGTLLLYTGAAIVDGVDPFYEAAKARLPEQQEYSYYEMDPDVFGEELENEPYRNADRIAAVVMTMTKI